MEMCRQYFFENRFHQNINKTTKCNVAYCSFDFFNLHCLTKLIINFLKDIFCVITYKMKRVVAWLAVKSEKKNNKKKKIKKRKKKNSECGLVLFTFFLIS